MSTQRPRTLIDEFRESWPKMNSVQQSLICLVFMHPAISMSEAAEAMNSEVATVHFHARSLGDGIYERESYGILQISQCSADKRKRLLTLTKLGMKAAKLLSPLNIPVNDELKIKPDENQLDLLRA